MYLYGAGEANPDSGSRHGFTREKVQQVWAEDGELHLADLLRCRVRYFSDSVAFGSRAYAEEIFEQQCGYFSEARASGARLFHGLSELCGLRDLRVDVVS
jgi:putative transposase